MNTHTRDKKNPIIYNLKAFLFLFLVGILLGTGCNNTPNQPIENPANESIPEEVEQVIESKDEQPVVEKTTQPEPVKVIEEVKQEKTNPPPQTPTPQPKSTALGEKYFQERKDCATKELSEHDYLTPSHAEYKCSTVNLAIKYYQQDPEGILDLCVKTQNISLYHEDFGFLAGIGPTTFTELQEVSDIYTDMVFDETTNRYIVGEMALTRWRSICKMVIENVLKSEE